MDSRHHIFIGSSTEGLPVARTLAHLLDSYTNLAPSLWNEGTFELSKTYIESLETELSKAHFAVLVLTPEDVIVSREHESLGPRDNVIFELGLFIGRLGRDRCFMVQPKQQPLKVPSDLMGVQPVGYMVEDRSSLHDALKRPAELIARHVEKIGPRAITSNEIMKRIELMRDFAARLVGAWWERFQLQGKESLAFFQIDTDATTNAVQMFGDAYGPGGEFEAHWETIAVRLVPEQKKLFYTWQGAHPRSETPAESFRGFGEFTFDDAADRFLEGRGSFSDVAGVSRATNWKSVSVRRVEREDDVVTMSRGREAEKKAIVLRVLSEL